MEKIYPINITGIKNIGTEKWLKSYYIPVTGKEFKNIYEKVFKSYFDTIKQYDNGIIYWITLSNINIPYYVSLYILELLRFIRLKEKGYEYIIGQKKEKIPESISAYKFPSLSNLNIIVKGMSELTPQERAKNILRTIKYNFSAPVSTNKYFLTNISSPVFFIGNRSQKEVVAYCNQNKISPIYLSPMLFAKSQYKGPNLEPQLSQLIGFSNDFLALIKERYFVNNENIFILLKRSLEEELKYSLIFFKQNLSVFAKHKPKTLLATGPGATIHRLFCSVWRYAGGRVIGFTHGNSYSHCYMSSVFIQYSMVDQFIASSKGHEEIIRQSPKDFMPDYKMPNMGHLENNIYKPLFGRLQSDPPVKKIKRIMVIGNIAKSYIGIDAEFHAFAFLYNELKLIELLKTAGYHVVYKARPDTLDETEGIFETYADQVLTDRLEDVYHYADCLLFSSPYSTTFGFSLLTNKPIVLINIKGYTWYPRAFELIKKRCYVVEAKTVDERIVFNEQDVIDAVQESINNINYDILYEFAF